MPHSNQVAFTKRRGMTVYKYTQVRKYVYIPPDFLLQMKSWFEKQSFKIKRNHRGPGHLSGRRDGIHINFVPKFLISVKNYADHAEVTFSYAARIRKIGIATAVLTEGLSLVVGAVTLTSHVAQARGFVDKVTDVMDSISGKPFEVLWTEATEVPGAETTSTTTRTVVNPPLPVIAPASPPRVRALTPPTPAPVIIEKVVEAPAPQPQIIIVPQSTIVVQAPPMGYYPYGMNGHGNPMLQDPSAFNNMNNMNNPFDFTNNENSLPQIAYHQPETIPIGNPTMPAQFQMPSMLHSTRYPMPNEKPSSAAAPSLLEIDYPMQRQSAPVLNPSAFSLTEPMFPRKEADLPRHNPFVGPARS